MLKAELVEMAVEAKMGEPCTVNRAYWVRHFKSLTKVELEGWLEGWTSGDHKAMAEVNRGVNARKRQLEDNARISGWKRNGKRR
jgi:hypothetical protein